MQYTAKYVLFSQKSHSMPADEHFQTYGSWSLISPLRNIIFQREREGEQTATFSTDTATYSVSSRAKVLNGGLAGSLAARKLWYNVWEKEDRI